MAWIAISDFEDNRFCATGLGPRSGDLNAQKRVIDPLKADPNALLVRGSIVIETRLSPDGRPQTLLAYERTHPWKSKISLQAIPGGGIAVIIMQGDHVFHTALNHNSEYRTDILRITYSWDAPRRWGRLAIERPELDKVTSIELKNPKPLMLDDIRIMATNPRQRHMDQDVVFFAVSDDIEPIGPTPTLTARVPVLGPSGYVSAGKLRQGDLVETLETGLVPVLQTVSRTVPARGSFQPVRLRAPYFGLQKDVIVAPDQRLVIGGPEVEYQFGREAVLVPARHLVNGVSAINCAPSLTATYHQIILPQHDTIITAGCPLESLYIGRIRRQPAKLDASLLRCFARNKLPEHRLSSYQMLKPFESVTLVQKRAA